ncbi:Uncharacterised protein [Mycobacteroides abscessus subsp. abscessus]|nr:Uncharacterised protein [Mycobacteroides abscessus subsp. abscessus]
MRGGDPVVVDDPAQVGGVAVAVGRGEHQLGPNLSCVTATPLGTPVEPEVKMT